MATLFSFSYLNLSVLALVLAPHQHQAPSTRFSHSSHLRLSTTNSLFSPTLVFSDKRNNVYSFKALYCLHTLFYINLCLTSSHCQLCPARPTTPIMPTVLRSKEWLGFRISQEIIGWDALLACCTRPFVSVHWPSTSCLHSTRPSGLKRITVSVIEPLDAGPSLPGAYPPDRELSLPPERLSKKPIACAAPLIPARINHCYTPCDLLSAYCYLYYPIRPLHLPIQVHIHPDSIHVFYHERRIVELSLRTPSRKHGIVALPGSDTSDSARLSDDALPLDGICYPAPSMEGGSADTTSEPPSVTVSDLTHDGSLVVPPRSMPPSDPALVPSAAPYYELILRQYDDTRISGPSMQDDSESDRTYSAREVGQSADRASTFADADADDLDGREEEEEDPDMTLHDSESDASFALQLKNQLQDKEQGHDGVRVISEGGCAANQGTLSSVGIEVESGDEVEDEYVVDSHSDSGSGSDADGDDTLLDIIPPVFSDADDEKLFSGGMDKPTYTYTSTPADVHALLPPSNSRPASESDLGLGRIQLQHENLLQPPAHDGPIAHSPDSTSQTSPPLPTPASEACRYHYRNPLASESASGRADHETLLRPEPETEGRHTQIPILIHAESGLERIAAISIPIPNPSPNPSPSPSLHSEERDDGRGTSQTHLESPKPQPKPLPEPETDAANVQHADRSSLPTPPPSPGGDPLVWRAEDLAPVFDGGGSLATSSPSLYSSASASPSPFVGRSGCDEGAVWFPSSSFSSSSSSTSASGPASSSASPSTSEPAVDPSDHRREPGVDPAHAHAGHKTRKWWQKIHPGRRAKKVFAAVRGKSDPDPRTPSNSNSKRDSAVSTPMSVRGGEGADSLGVWPVPGERLGPVPADVDVDPSALPDLPALQGGSTSRARRRKRLSTYVTPPGSLRGVDARLLPWYV